MTDQPNTSGPQADKPRRMEAMKLWKLLLGACVAHVVLIGLFSLGGGGQETNPNVVIEKARSLREEKKYELALEAYLMVVNQKPAIPAVFLEAEKEMHDCRMEALQAKREAQQAASDDDDGRGEPPPETPAADQGERPEPGSKDEPPVDLPNLPSIEGEF